MSILSDRIHNEQYLSTPSYHPVGTGETPHVMPQSVVTYAGETVLYGMVHPLVTADGAVVPAQSGTSYPSVVPAGRP